MARPRPAVAQSTAPLASQPIKPSTHQLICPSAAQPPTSTQQSACLLVCDLYEESVPPFEETVESWLIGLGLSELLPRFLETGYDDLVWIREDDTEATGLTATRLAQLEIGTVQQRQSILTALGDSW